MAGQNLKLAERVADSGICACLSCSAHDEKADLRTLVVEHRVHKVARPRPQSHKCRSAQSEQQQRLHSGC